MSNISSESNTSTEWYDEEERDDRMAEQVKRLNIARGQCKATITRAEKFFTDTPLESITTEDLQIRQKSICAAYEKYQSLSIDMQLLDVEVDADDEEMESRYTKLEVTIQRLLSNSVTKCGQAKTTEANHSAAHLTSLEIPVFDGRDISLYKPFMEMFEAVVHHDNRLSDVQKLCFLKKYVRGEPLQLIDSLPIVGVSYTDAVSLLKKRYDNEALLIHNHVCNLLDLPAVQRGTAQQLRELTAKVRCPYSWM
ncbi:uncharacterized protein LOC126376654 isoform X3 [Pectinophora gossypiella]|uniref:uncharacterized protein LOC126376654 isoform X3 n=1 Tax=Pectinophora gossypiella TaxID=13191 RepID=UPI00214F2F95|nr:uncharacterized protein LOC126376654 isoform X3 [Pectinophora gossypiella]